MSNDLFILGWLEDPDLANDCLAILRDKAARYRTQGVYEDDTRAIFVETLLRGLSWDTLDHEQVDRESNREEPTIADIHLGGKNPQRIWKVAAIIEAKRLDASPSGLRLAYVQLRGYVLNTLFNAPAGSNNEKMRLQLDGEPFVRGVVTNGACWSVYDFDPAVVDVPPENHLEICDFELQGDGDPSQLIRALGRNYLLNRLGLSAT
jgi:hypothetical protein